MRLLKPYCNVLIPAFLFLFLASYIYIWGNTWLDWMVYNFIQHHPLNPGIETVLAWITHLCDEATVFTIATFAVITALFIQKFTTQSILILLEALLAGMVNAYLKMHLTRPLVGPAEIELQGFVHSFPSGHSMIAVCLYGLLLYFISRRFVPQYQAVWIFATVFFAALMGLSRLVLNYHCLSDVLGGYLFGYGLLISGIYAYNRITIQIQRK